MELANGRTVERDNRASERDRSDDLERMPRLGAVGATDERDEGKH